MERTVSHITYTVLEGTLNTAQSNPIQWNVNGLISVVGLYPQASCNGVIHAISEPHQCGTQNKKPSCR